MKHIPILVKEILDLFASVPLSVFIDGTVGAGGHAKAMLEAHPEVDTFYAIDQDEEALEIAATTLAPFEKKVSFIHANYRYMKEVVEDAEVDGVFLDLGVSSMQLDQAEKGFSFSKEGPLDMRQDATQRKDAAFVVNTYSEKELGRIFREYGEERRWRRAAKVIVEERRRKRIKTTLDLVAVLQPVLTWGGRERRKLHPMTLVFQALRIEVNDELKALQEGLEAAFSLLKIGGRLGVLSFHRLEDRLVKNAFREEKRGRIITKKPLVASELEVAKNRRARSAKLRFIERME